MDILISPPLNAAIPTAKEEPTMPIEVRVTWRNDNPDTIWNKLAARLGREPTNAEAKEEVLRILRSTRDAAK